MNAPVAPDGQGSSTRPYLIRALHEWCTDNGYTPYVAVHVDATVQVPAEYVKNGEIVLNVGFEATSALELGNEVISFRARFGGVARDIVVPVDRVVAIYARENGQGMAFPVPAPASAPARGAAAVAAGAPVASATPALASSPAVSPLRLAKTSAPAPAPAPAAPAAAGGAAAGSTAPAQPADAAAQAPSGAASASPAPAPEASAPGPQPDGPAPGKRPALTRIK